MGLPHPEVGLVLNYAYLWRREHRVGREESSKYRPAVVVLVVGSQGGAHPLVTVLPITHVAPSSELEAVEIPAAVKSILDSTRNAHGSWSAKATDSAGPVLISGNGLIANDLTTDFCRRASSRRRAMRSSPSTERTVEFPSTGHSFGSSAKSRP